jgi:uncharacterized membrane protein
MPDPIIPTDKTHPLDAGHTTTEYKTTRWIVVLTSIIGVLSTVVSYTDQAKLLFGADSKIGLWIGIGTVALGALTSILYTVQRSAIKIAALKAGEKMVVTAESDPAAANLGG